MYRPRNNLGGSHKVDGFTGLNDVDVVRLIDQGHRDRPGAVRPSGTGLGPSELRRSTPTRSAEELLIAAGRGDRQAFATLVERYHRAVMQFIFRFLGDVDRSTTEDLAQDVFLKAWKSAPGYRPRAKALTWLLQIARNTSLNYRRAHRLRQTVSLAEADGVVDEGVAGEADSQSQDRARGVQAALMTLPHKQRAAIVLRHYLDLTYSDIAETLGVSVSAVESLLFRARTSLRDLLAQEGNIHSSPQVIRPSGAEPLREDKVL